MKSLHLISIQLISNDDSPICHARKSNHDSCLTSLQISENDFLKSLEIAIDKDTSDDEKQPQYLTLPPLCLTVGMVHSSL